MERIKWVEILKGDRLASAHYYEIKKNDEKKQIEEEEEMIEEGKNSIMEKEKVNSDENIKMKFIYNDNQLIEDKKREIRKLKRDRRSNVKKN